MLCVIEFPRVQPVHDELNAVQNIVNGPGVGNIPITCFNGDGVAMVQDLFDNSLENDILSQRSTQETIVGATPVQNMRTGEVDFSFPEHSNQGK